MRKTLIKNSHSKARPANAEKNKPTDVSKKNAPESVVSKKTTGNIMLVLNYQYQDSDLEQFVF